MKRLLAICGLVLAVLIFVPTVARAADDDWRISRFHSLVEVQLDGRVKVTESITAEFGDNSKHGIFRNIPFQYSTNNQDLYTKIDVWSVERDGQEEQYETTSQGGYEIIKIGDPNKTISGQQQYELTYYASGVLLDLEEYDELYWNVTGNQWLVPIDSASATVTLPKKEIVQQRCYQGVRGSQDSCQSLVIGPLEARFTSSVPLEASEGLTVAVGYTKGIVPIIIVERPQSTADKIVAAGKQPITWLVWFAAMIIGILLPFLVWWKKGRDWHWSAPASLEGNQQPAFLRPLFAKPQIVAEFTPPNDLRPAQLGLLIDEKVDTLDVSSTIVDLAARGWLTIQELEKKWIFGSNDYQLTRTNKTDEGLLAYEKLLLDKLFGGQATITLSSLKNKFYQDLPKVQQAVYDSLQAKKYFVDDPQSVRNRYLLFGVLLIVVGAGGLWVSLQVLSNIWLATIGAIPVVAGVVMLWMSQAMPQRTAVGYEAYRRTLGYKDFIATAEKYPQQFFEQQNMFNQIMPYVMVFGLTHKFAEAMKVIGYEPSQPGWYSGQSAFNVIMFSNGLNHMSSAMNNTLASAPSSSGSGGGGSSGGGFGGGGGGSW